jgi:Metal-dependent hydrolases of the beta-lactamase superfamily III
MKVTLLGTGSPIPDPLRAGPSTLVQAGDLNLLFDCGRGVLMRLAAAGLFPPFLHQVVLTHLHSDHTTDFNDLVTSRWVMSPIENPLPVIGPPGTAMYVDRVIAMLTDDIGYRRGHHADLQWDPSCVVQEVLDGVVFDRDGVRLIAAPSDHRPVEPTTAFRIEHDGHAVVIAGDTVPCEGIDRLCAGADVYVQTVIRDDLIKLIPMPRIQDVLDYHSSVEQAGQTAARAGVKTLVFTHPVPGPMPGAEPEWIAMAAAHFDGEIIFAEDLTVVNV